MSRVNRVILDKIFFYKSKLESEIQNFTLGNDNIIDTPNFKLFAVVSGNILNDLNYLLTVNPDTDLLGLAGLYRNVRNSIEAFYDLYILTNNPNYISLLRLSSNFCDKSEEDLNVAKTEFNIKNIKFLTISTKAVIAQDKYNLVTKFTSVFKDISKLTNSYIHPDIFAPKDNDKAIEIQKILGAECYLLCYAFDLLHSFIYITYNLQTTFNPHNEIRDLMNDLSFNDYPTIIA